MVAQALQPLLLSTLPIPAEWAIKNDGLGSIMLEKLDFGAGATQLL